MSDRVSIIVVNWNGLVFLEKCLASLQAQTYPNVELILIDNGSTDGSQAWVSEHFPQIRLICNPTNVGFAAACNIAIQASQGQHVALLNNDAWAEPHWIAALMTALARDARYGMVASQMLFASAPTVINSTGICMDRCGITWDRAGGQPADDPQQAPVEVFGPCGGAALYRKTMLAEVGLFDEDFFGYLEDVDLAWRAQWLGWRGVYAPAARIYHIHSGTNKEGSPFKTQMLSRNKLWLLIQNYPWPYCLSYWPLILFYEVLSHGYALTRRVGWSATRGRWEAVRQWPIAWHKRQRLLKRAKTSASDIFRLLEPVPWPTQVYGRYRHLTHLPLPSSKTR